MNNRLFEEKEWNYYTTVIPIMLFFTIFLAWAAFSEIDEAVKKQLDKIAHTTLLGLINKPSAELAKKLVEVTPKGLNKVFYSDDGSTAVEAAVKIAFQYWQHKGLPEKQQFINLGDSYHGDTVGAVSVGNIDVFHKVYKHLKFVLR